MGNRVYCYEQPRPAVATRVVIFTILEDELKLLLSQRARPVQQDLWALPGGCVGLKEDLEANAVRELAEETGVRGVYLEQLYTRGQSDNRPENWEITVAYYALVPSDRLQIKAASAIQAVGWFALGELPPLSAEHREIVALAHRRLAAKLDYSTIAFQFMPEKFTLSELQAVYEIILRERMDKRNFRKWVMALERIEDTGEERRHSGRRPARLYRAKFPGKVEIIK